MYFNYDYSIIGKLSDFQKKLICISKKLCSNIRDYIEQNISKNIKMADVAIYLGYNEKYISGFFQRNGY